MKDYTKESEHKEVLKQRRADKRAIAYTLLFGGFFVGYMVAHVVIYLMR